MKILVTGGTGVVGAGTVTELLGRGHEVVLLSRHAADDARQWPSGVTARPGDVADADSIRGAADGCALVLHMVGIVEEDGDATFERINVQGSANMIAEATRARVPRFVYVSSLGAPTGESAYHRSKAHGEALVRRFAGEWVIVRPGNVYGPGDEQISLLLRLVRGPTPLVPRIGDGDQPIQPIWWEDCARALATIVERTDLAGRELDIAGVDRTSQNDLIERFGRITGRDTVSVAVPDMLATIGARAISLVGWEMSFTDDQLIMLHEGNVVPEDGENALTTVLGVTPTSLDAGLKQLADLQPEQLPSSGIGSLKRKRFWADINGCNHDAESLFALFRRSFNRVTPVYVDATAEPRTDAAIVEGETLTLALPMRGHVQVRAAEMSARHVTFLTLEGHPLAGAVRFDCQPRGAAVRFQIEVFDRAANVIDLIAMRTMGDRMQSRTWEQVVRNMVTISGGEAPDDAQQESATLNEAEAADVEGWLAEIVTQLKRDANAEKIAAAQD